MNTAAAILMSSRKKLGQGFLDLQKKKETKNYIKRYANHLI